MMARRHTGKTSLEAVQTSSALRALQRPSRSESLREFIEFLCRLVDAMTRMRELEAPTQLLQ
jgi:hypothetical protein